MWKWYKRIVLFGNLLLLGYLGTGIILHYLKPRLRLLPEFVTDLLPSRTWEIKQLPTGDLTGFRFQLLSENPGVYDREILFTDQYADEDGVFCFRGNAQRNAPTRGVLSGKPTRIYLDWQFETGYDARVSEHGSWGGGSGWTGQPLVVKWTRDEMTYQQTINPDFASQASLKEVIVGSLCGEIYFLDWNTGKKTRKPLSIDNPIKGTVSLDPRKNGLLYVGQGIKNGERFGAYVFDIFSGKEVFFRSGLDAHAYRRWGAFDSNSLIDPETGRWFHPAENGLIYVTDVSNKNAITTLGKFKYQVVNRPNAGIESSMAAWNNLAWFGDNGGNVFCLDLKAMKPVWLLDNYDDTDASMVLDLQENKNNPYLYVGNEVDLQGEEGTAFIRKIDALTGKELWSVERKSTNKNLYGRVNSGGVLASVLPGKKKASGLVYGIFARVNGTLKGEFVAIDKVSGKEKFSIPMATYSWASPIDMYDKEGNCYVFFTDVYGGIYLIDGLTGEIIYHEKTSFVWESSPIAWGNRIVVGSRGNRIVSFVVK